MAPKTETSRGNLILVLNAHLPFVKHPNHDFFLEEVWLYEALSETYLPFLRMCRRLEEDKIPFKMTVSLSPTLSAMFADELLQDRYIRHLNLLLELGAKEKKRCKASKLLKTVDLYLNLFQENLYDFRSRYEKNILRGFREFQDKGFLEIITTAATHCFLPSYILYPELVRAQVEVACQDYRHHFKRRPKGFWLPECGYCEGMDRILRKEELDYTFLSAHGVLYGSEKPRYGTFAPVRCHAKGPAVFPRNRYGSRSVWEKESGFPSHEDYRDFYRDIGFELPVDYLKPYLWDNFRLNTGFKYRAVGCRKEAPHEKKDYDPVKAGKQVKIHAEEFIGIHRDQFQKANPHMDIPPLSVCPFDAELFGHWWFEGISFLEEVFRNLRDIPDMEALHPSEYLELYPDRQIMEPCPSSWGDKGYSEVWINGNNDWLYPFLHQATEDGFKLMNRFKEEKDPLKIRVINQLVRELLLSQGSDWPFIMRTGTFSQFAENTVKKHLKNFYRLAEILRDHEKFDLKWFLKIESRNNVFPLLQFQDLIRKG